MFEKDTAYLAVETMGLLTKIFQNDQISHADFISNTKHKVRFLEEYIKNNNDSVENIKIIKLLVQHNLMLKVFYTTSK